jgi:DNA-binding MarR family transcriptional regulator
MNPYTLAAPPDPLLRTLADFRYELRRFVHFSEAAALEVGLQPQQHQLLLQVAGAPDGTAVTIAYAAERLGLRHNSAVELVDRSVHEGLLIRRTDADDRRRAILHITHRGRQLLARLSGDHARELNELGPRLERALRQIRLHAPSPAGLVAQ